MNMIKTIQRISLLVMALSLAGCKAVVLEPSGDVAAQQRDLLVISTLLMLVAAFAGHAETLKAYRHAVEQRYRFFSYGDAMFITGQ